MNFPKDVRYTSEHEWIRVEGEEALVGITDYAQSELGERVFIDVPTLGETVAQGEVFGSVVAPVVLCSLEQDAQKATEPTRINLFSFLISGLLPFRKWEKL